MRKQILFLLGGVLIVAALVAVGWFLLTSPAPAVENVEIEGCWKVCKENNVAVEDEYMIFAASLVTDSRDGETRFAGEYTLKGRSLSVEGLGTTFEITPISARQMVLSGSDGSRRELMAVDGTACAPEELSGSWRVVMHAGKSVTGELITFDAGTLKDTRDGKKYLECSYTYRDGVIAVAEMNMELEAYTAGESLMLYERGSGYVWELEREDENASVS